MKAYFNNLGEDGFTLVETLISLVILAIASSILLQSIVQASNQINAAKRLVSAGNLAVAILAEHSVKSSTPGITSGVDEQAKLFWTYTSETERRVADGLPRTSFELIQVVIRLKEAGAPIYKLATVAIKAPPL